MSISIEQLHDLLIGIAKSQNAIIEAIEEHLGKEANFRRKYLTQKLQAIGGIPGNALAQNPQEIPARLLLQFGVDARDRESRLKDILSQI